MNQHRSPAIQTVLILDDDLMVTAGLAAALERPGRNIVVCNDIESAQLTLEWLAPTHIVSDVHITGQFGFEGLDFVHYAKRHLPGSRTILMTGDAPEALQIEAAERGAVAFLKKPFEVAELDALIDLTTTAPARDGQAGATIRLPLLDEILSGGNLSAVFQPIVKLGDKWEPFAFEGLTRLRTDSPLANPEWLFQYAARKHRVTDLETACIENALAVAGPLVARGLLFLNIHPSLFGDGRMLSDLFLRHAARGELRLDRIVLEVTEQEALKSAPGVFDNFERLRELGIRFAFDDFGVAYSHLPLIDRIRPSFLKISQHFGTGFERDLTKVRIVTNFTSLAHDFGCDLILEGIEETATADAALRLGIRYGQGFLFGKPTPMASSMRLGEPENAG